MLIVTGKAEGKRPIGKSRRNEDTIKMDFK
jgi:hypothetical protein